MSAYEQKLAQMVAGYVCGFNGVADVLPDCYRNESAAWRHGWCNGRDDRTNRVRDTAAVLRRRAEMILRSAA